MSSKSPAKAGKEAAQRTSEEQDQVLADAKAPTEKQQDEVTEAGPGTPPAEDHTGGTDAGGLVDAGPAPAELRAPELKDPEAAPEPPVQGEELLGTNVVRHRDQRVGVVSASAFNVSTALKLTPNTEWSKSLDKAIRSFQKELGARETGYLTRDQCRRLGLSLQP